MLCVFTFTDKNSRVPIVYFYDIKSKKEIAKVSGASIFLNYIPNKSAESKSGKLYFYCDYNLTTAVLLPAVKLKKDTNL